MLVYLALLDLEEDQGKFETIYELYHRQMYAAAHRILGKSRAAEDAVHEAFLKIIEHLEKISDPKCPQTRAFVVTIVEHKAIDLYRRQKRRPILPIDEMWDAGAEDPSLAAVNEGSPVARAIARLPERYRSLILLKFDCGYSEREIAEMLDMSEANVKKTIQRAKTKLAALLAEEGVEI